MSINTHTSNNCTASNRTSRYRLKLITVAIAAMVISACSDKDSDVDIPLSAVPANIVTIVQNTLPGIALTEAEKETDNEKVIYELEGKMINGLEYEIKITEDGTILKIELDD